MAHGCFRNCRFCGLIDIIAKAAEHHTNNSVAVCSSVYEVRGGCRDFLKGRYSRMPVPVSCSGQPVYDRDGAGQIFLYKAIFGGWGVSNLESMQQCEASWYTYYAQGDCECLGDAGCKGTWVTNTGSETDDGECEASTWCSSGIWLPMVQL
jgi:hypothetical protein